VSIKPGVKKSLEMAKRKQVHLLEMICENEDRILKTLIF
jgi:hypothetical protein